MRRHGTLGRECLAEVIGTFTLVFFGVGAVHTAVLTGAQVGLWQVAVVWGAAVSLAIYATGAVSGAHLNPAITLAFAAYRGFPLRKTLPYVASQVLGAFAAAAVLYALFHNILTQFEAAHGLVRGAPGSELSAMMYGEYFPNPALLGTTAQAFAAVTLLQAMVAEAIGTAFLAFFVLGVTDARNPSRPNGPLFALLIGLTLAIVISIIAPLTQAGLNPARDFGPRLFALLAGWGSIAIPGPHGGFFTVYILAPILGAQAGAAIYQFLVRPALPWAADEDIQLSNGVPHMANVTLILVGGFLGAGKTTLLSQTARRLAQQGKRVGIITNDQASQLVDTGLLQGSGAAVEEIAGGCFCCRFSELVSASDRLLAEAKPEVLIGEPVGSCTDISATVLQPLKDKYADRFRVAPFSVLVDPCRLREVLEPRLKSPLHASARYILRKQLEEADVIVLNKVDLLSADELSELRQMLAERFPDSEHVCISALAGDGVDAWLDRVLAGGAGGQRITEVDYDVYAEGEAVLGWLNATIALQARHDVDWRAFCLDLLRRLQAAFRERGAEIAHVKLLLSADGGQYAANLTRAAGAPFIRGEVAGFPRDAQLIVNARVEMSPEELKGLVEECLRAAAGEDVVVRIVALESLSPARPRPTYRYAEVV